MNTGNYEQIYVSNGLGGPFTFDNVPMDEDNDIVEWFITNNISTLVGANYSSCQWGLYCVGIDVGIKWEGYDYIGETGEWIKKVEKEEEKEEEELPMMDILSKSFLGQLEMMNEYPEDYDNVFPNKYWKLEDYEEMFKLINTGHLIQSDESVGFVWNPEFEQEEEEK